MIEEKKRVRIVRYRLKIGNPDILLVQCWFLGNDKGDCELIFLLGDKRLLPKVSTKEGVEIRRKHLVDSSGIDKEYFFWLPLPKDINNMQYLRIFETIGGKSSLVYVISCSKIIKLKNKIEKYIKEPIIIDDKVTLSGWYVSDNSNVNIRVEGKQDKNINFRLKELYRHDVVTEYPETNRDNVHGFEIEMNKPCEKVIKVIIEDGRKISKSQFEISNSKVKKGILEAKKLGVKSINYFKANGVKKTLKRAAIKVFKIDENDYKVWLKKNQPDAEELENQRDIEFEYHPLISIVVPLYRTPLKYLDELIESIREQTYTNWELCLSDGSGEKGTPLINALERYVELDGRIKIVINENALRISENTNEAIKIAKGEYIAFVDHDDLLAPNALFECIKAININRDIDVLYSDEDKISIDSKYYFEPHFKTDFNIDLLCSMNYICHMFVVNKGIIQQIGMMRSEFDGAQDYDFILRSAEVANCIWHIPKALYHWRASENSTSENPESKVYAFEAGARAIQEHYDRVGISAEVFQGDYWGLYRTKHILNEHPMISIVIPNMDHVKDLKKCIDAMEEKNSYDNYEYIIIENNSIEEETFQYYETLKLDNRKVQIIYWDKEFNYSAINNYGVKFAQGEYLLFLNNDTEVITEECLEELLGYCMHDNVGAVGARLYYADDTIQHAGVIVGFGGIAGHAFLGLSRNETGYFSRILCAQDLSAVTAACMMVKKTVFEEVGGFDEKLKVAFNDVDLCMKMRQAGYLIVYNPYAELYHYESKSRGYEDTREKVDRFNGEINRFKSKWPEILKNGDPYYNPNLSMEREDFGLK